MRLLVVAMSGAALLTTVSGQDNTSRATEHTLASHENSLYFVVPPRDEKAGQKSKPAGLVVVLPGGSGGRGFLPWVENGILGAAPLDCVGVLVTAVKWQDSQSTVWPTAASKVDGMKYTTDDYVRAVTAEVEKTYTIDPERRVILAWSSSVPAVYPMLTAKDSPFERAYMAMGIWPKDAMQKLRAVKQRRFFLDHSPEDQGTTFRHARRAYQALDKAGAIVELRTYEGGHGWQDMPIPRVRDGLSWLLSDSKASKPKWPAELVASRKGKIVNLLQNPGFERDLTVWDQLGNSGRAEFLLSTTDKTEGAQALHLKKQGGPPLDLLVQEVELPAGKSVTVSVSLKSVGAANARIMVRLYDEDDELVHQETELVHVPADSEWHTVEKTWSAKDTRYAVVQVLTILGGEVWLDDVTLYVTK